ncbi:glycosyltransferase family 32 protein [Ningiella sp. W23]|uniref:glycosyltransferase family 32 protein n=1 Tax=Ningiella sp. W23 TaxID=3023715 RepID=UPI00375846A5
MLPRTLVQYWHQFPLPADIEQLTESWRSCNPWLAIEHFDDTKASMFLLQEYGDEIKKLYQSAALPAMKSDIFRVAYCLAYGGMYIDMATKCLSSIEPLFANEDKLTVMRKWHGGIWNGLIICQASNPTLNAIWEMILENLRTKAFNDVWRATGPYNFNEAIDKQYENKLDEKAQAICVLEQRAINTYFDLVNDLEHKKNNHWSDIQKNQSIYKE